MTSQVVQSAWPYWTYIYVLGSERVKNKSDATRATEQFLADTSPYGKVKRLRSDNGGEYINEEFRSLMLKNQIKHEEFEPHSPHQNGPAERTWRSLFDMARCLLIGAELPKQLWTYAVLTSAHICNRCYNHRTGKTPYDCLTGIKPNLSNMQVLMVQCVMHMYRTKPNWMLELRKVFLWAMTGPALHFLCLTHIKTLWRKSDVSSSLRGLTMLMKV